MMFRLPTLAELMQHCQLAECDMCRVGELRDPINNKLMKKSVTILTSVIHQCV